MDIVTLILLMTLSVPVSNRFKITVSRSLVVIMGLIMISGYIGGLFGHIFLGISILICILLLDLIYCTLRHKIKFNCDIGIAFLGCMIILQILYHRYSVINNWDDWSHWAVQAKNIFYTAKFPCSEGNSISLYLDYFPGIQIWEAFWMKIGNMFSDSRLYIAFNMAIYIVFAGLISSVKKSSGIVLAIVLTCSCNLFGLYMLNTITMDIFLSVLLGWGLWLLYTGKYNKIELMMVIGMLSLSKQVGCLFALVILAILFSELVIDWKKNTTKLNSLNLKILFMYTCVEMFMIATWTIVKHLHDVMDTGSELYKNILKEGILNYINQLEEWHITGFFNFWSCFFDFKIVDTDLCTAFYLSPWIKVPAIVYIIVLAMFMIYLTKHTKGLATPPPV